MLGLAGRKSTMLDVVVDWHSVLTRNHPITEVRHHRVRSRLVGDLAGD